MSPPSYLKFLDTVQSSSIRIATGAFSTSPTLSLCAEAGIPPLPYRRQYISVKLLTLISQNQSIPAYNRIFDPLYERLFLNNHSLHLRLNLENCIHHSATPHPLPPIFSSTPSWLFHPPPCILELTGFPKASTTPEIIISHLKLIIDRFPSFTPCYTDGSKRGNRTGFAFTVGDHLFSHRHRNSEEIFQCLQTISHLPEPLSSEYFLIFTDSLSSLRSILSYNPTNPLTQRIQVILHSLSTTFKKIIFIRIPSHIGIRGNETVDRAAQQATLLPKIKSKILPTPSDLTHHLRQLVLKQWFKYWKEQSLSPNKLAQLKPLPVPWASSNRLSRRQEIILTRLRIGHSRITHTHIITDLFPPSCPYCNIDFFPVDHFFTCPHLKLLRIIHQVPHDRIKALADDESAIDNTLKYLSQTVFLPLI